MKQSSLQMRQKEICKKYGSQFYEYHKHETLGISINVKENIMPLNGFRHPPEGDTCGWYIYAAEELKEDIDFFKPLHIEHIQEWCPQVQKYLGLAPGWRFLIAEDYEDVWFDESLLKV